MLNIKSFTRASAAGSFKFHVHVKVSSAPTSRQPKIIPLAGHHFSRRRWSFIANNNSVLANLLFAKPETIGRIDRCASERLRAVPAKRFYPALPASTISQLSFPSIRRRIFFFFSFEERRVREKPRRGIVSLEYIQITGGAESHRRFVGVPAIISQVALSRATSSIPPFRWINLLVVYIPSALSLPSSIHPLSPHSCPFLSPYCPPVSLPSIFFPFCVASLFHFRDLPPSSSFLPSSPSRFSATSFDYSVIAT